MIRRTNVEKSFTVTVDKHIVGGTKIYDILQTLFKRINMNDDICI